MSADADAWSRVAAGELDVLEELLAGAAAVQLVERGERWSGPDAAAALRASRRLLPDLEVAGRVDDAGGVAVAWLSFTGLPWLPDRVLHGAFRADGDTVAVVGTFESALLHAHHAAAPAAATLPPNPVHPNALLLRAGYDDPSIHAAVFTDDFVAHTLGHNRTAGDWHGPAEMAGHLGQILALTDGTMHVAPLTRFALANDRFGVVFSRATARRGDRRVDQYVCGVWRFADGRIAEHWELFSDPATWDAFWSDDG